METEKHLIIPKDFKIHEIPRSLVIDMLREEQVIRYSKGIQEAYTQQFYAQQNNPNYEVVQIEREVQKYILRTFGFKDDDNSLREYWKIPSTYWNDEEVKNSVFYMKLNIFQYPKVSVGDDLIDVNLVEYLTNKTVSLISLQTQNRPLVLLAGSMT
jgi:hypothetical protein